MKSKSVPSDHRVKKRWRRTLKASSRSYLSNTAKKGWIKRAFKASSRSYLSNTAKKGWIKRTFKASSHSCLHILPGERKQNEFGLDGLLPDWLSYDRKLISIFEIEDNFKNVTIQTETLNPHRTVVEDVFENSADEENLICFDFDKFHGKGEAVHALEEMKETVTPVSLDIFETNIASKNRLEKLMENSKIKLLEDDEIPPFQKQFISLCSENIYNMITDSLDDQIMYFQEKSFTNNSFDLI